MSLKKAVFFGGALLVLAACGDSTAPTSPSALRRVEGNSAALTATPPTSPAPKGKKPPLTNTLGCSMVIRLGLDGEIVTSECSATDLQ